LSDLNTDIKKFKDQLSVFALIGIPAILVLLQKDAGSTLVYGAFIFVLYREGLSPAYLIIGLLFIVLCLLSLKFGVLATSLIMAVIVFVHHFVRKRKPIIIQPIALILIGILASFVTKYFYDNVLPSNQKERMTIYLSLEKDAKKLEQMKKSIACNLNKSEKAISTGGLTGKTFFEGTRTTRKLVPEQHTNYIFSTVSE